MRARGLTWDVLAVDRAAGHERLGLRCVDGDMAGLEWEAYMPPDRIELLNGALDTECPVPLSLWRLMHRAHLLNELPGTASFVARDPGRVRVEPYQLVPLMRALDMPRPRLLLADGVGLGKTIQAGLIAAELIARRRAHRILIVAPSGPLLWQWEQETRLRFGLKFTLVTSAAELWDVRRAHELGANPFDSVSLCITALDFAKQDYVLEEIERSAWDLVIIDEAHHCAGFGSSLSQGSTDRRRLAEVLARRSDGLLLLTATPHDGHDAHFASLIALLDPSLVDGAGGFVGTDYRRHVVRRMKAHIRDPVTGAPLFHRRRVVPVTVDVGGVEHEGVRDFHRALSAFVMPRLRRRTGSDDALAFISLLKRSVSTISACLETLRVVLERLSDDDGDTSEPKAARRERGRALRAWRRRVARYGTLGAADEVSQQTLEIESMAESLRLESDTEAARLILLGLAAEPHDPKLSTMVLEIRLIRARYPDTNILIYTEYSDSLAAAARALRSASGIEGEILTIGGLDDDAVRATTARQFGETGRLILITTDSMAEGLNLHRHCFHLIHLDLPYNPNRLEQRNGRIDRYGQEHEPDIRYLFIPGTFEEALLLHLIAKYEKARSALDVMPETLGVTALSSDFDGNLTNRLSEDPGDLFETGTDLIQTLDRAAGDSKPEVIADLMREIDRAFEAFDLMAVCHGWYGARGLNAGLDQLRGAETMRLASPASEDLPAFVAAVAATETKNLTVSDMEIRLPANWIQDLDGLPGFEPTAGLLRFTRDADTWRDTSGRTVGYLGRAHPLTVRAIRHGIQLDGAPSVARGDHLGLLLTFEVSISDFNRSVFRHIVAIAVEPGRSPIEMSVWLDQAEPGPRLSSDGIWDRLFASWAGPARARSETLAAEIASRDHRAFVERHETMKHHEVDRSNRWLRTQCDRLCGSFVTPTYDLFGAPPAGPEWRHRDDPHVRLLSFATDPETTGPKRREANDILEAFRMIEPSSAAPDTVVTRPIGILMLVPEDAI